MRTTRRFVLAIGGLAIGCARVLGVEDVSYPPEAGDGATDAAAPPADACRSRYRDEVMKDAPLAYFPLGESPPVATDAVDGGPKGTYIGNATVAPSALPCDPGSATRLDGKQARVVVDPAYFNFDQVAPFSLEAWVRAKTVDTTYRRIIGKEISSGTPQEGYALSVHRDADGTTYLELTRAHAPTNDVAGLAAPFPDPAKDGAFHHVVATFDGGKLAIYVDGVVETKPAQFAIVTTNVPFVIGGRDPATDMFDGDLDEVAVYGHALPPERVKAHLDAR